MATKRDARGRQRDYAAERRRRNELARALGFSSLDTLGKARKTGRYPSAKAIKTDPVARAKAADITQERLAARARAARRKREEEERAEAERAWSNDIVLDGQTAKQIDVKNRNWSHSHSHQFRTKYTPSEGWSRQRIIDYYKAFVRDFLVPNDERNFNYAYDYLYDYDLAEPEEFVDNPYRGA